jgi:hypothetical protein
LACPRSHVSDRSAGNNPFQVNPVERHRDGLAVAASELGAGFNRIIKPPEPDDVIGRVGELHLSRQLRFDRFAADTTAQARSAGGGLGTELLVMVSAFSTLPW